MARMEPTRTDSEPIPSRIPSLRRIAANDRPFRPEGTRVVYWMTSARRRGWNFGLERAVELAIAWRRPLVILEALRCGYRWASDRIHTFVLQGMADNARAFAGTGVAYHAYLEPEPGAGRGLVEALARDACAVITDDFPCFFLPRMHAAAAARIPCRLERVDGNGLLPLRATDQVFPTAYAFRRFLQRELPPHLLVSPRPDPLEAAGIPPAAFPPELARRWPGTPPALLEDPARLVASLPIDHGVGPGARRGGAEAGCRQLETFVARRLSGYGADRNHPDRGGGSGLSPYLHFGHVGAHQVLAAIADAEDWYPDRVMGAKATGKKSGWWGMGESAEAFLDEAVTWRELGYHQSAKRADYDRYQGLPDWAKRTLAIHAGDPRPRIHSLPELAGAATGDPVWNAAQRQLAGTGELHNYLRMLWGKKVLLWSETPEEASLRLVELNNRYALDGRDPNSYSGIFWVLGRYDRPWGPERPIYGTVRYMTSENTLRKLEMREYMDRWAPTRPGPAPG